MRSEELIVVRGGGDLATGVIQKFFRSGFRLLILETDEPTAIRRTVSLCEAVYAGQAEVEDLYCRRIQSLDELEGCHENGVVPLLTDPGGGKTSPG